MISLLAWIILGFLIVISILDWKFRAIPSILLTGFLFVAVALNPSNIVYGLLGGIIAILFWEIDIIRGLADIKVISIIAMLISSLNMMFLFIFLICFFGLIWVGVIKFSNWAYFKRDENECAFIPVLLLCYVTLLIMGGIS
jgi:hypothetical protein